MTLTGMRMRTMQGREGKGAASKKTKEERHRGNTARNTAEEMGESKPSTYPEEIV